MTREIVFGVGLPLLLPLFMQLDGVLFFMPIADVLTAIASIVVIINTNKTLDQLIDMSETKNTHIESTTNEIPLTDYIITIGRFYGAGGRSIGKKVAKQLNITYYDSKLLEKTAKNSGISHKYLQSID